MQKLFLLRLSQLTHSDMAKSVIKFMQAANDAGKTVTLKELQDIVHQEGGLQLDQYTPEVLDSIKQNGVIYLFKIGKLTEEEFVTKMNEKLGIPLSVETFKECWNAMCTITSDTFDFLYKLQDLKTKFGFNIHVIGNTNIMHAEYIMEQIRNKDSDLLLNTEYTFSFNVGCFDPMPQINHTEGLQIIDLRNTDEHLLEAIEMEYTPKQTSIPRYRLS